jgi:hypothetical protein
LTIFGSMFVTNRISSSWGSSIEQWWFQSSYRQRPWTRRCPLESSRVDIFCYQDAVGAGYIPYQNTYDPAKRLAQLDHGDFNFHWPPRIGLGRTPRFLASNRGCSSNGRLAQPGIQEQCFMTMEFIADAICPPTGNSTIPI